MRGRGGGAGRWSARGSGRRARSGDAGSTASGWWRWRCARRGSPARCRAAMRCAAAMSARVGAALEATGLAPVGAAARPATCCCSRRAGAAAPRDRRRDGRADPCRCEAAAGGGTAGLVPWPVLGALAHAADRETDDGDAGPDGRRHGWSAGRSAARSARLIGSAIDRAICSRPRGARARGWPSCAVQTSSYGTPDPEAVRDDAGGGDGDLGDRSDRASQQAERRQGPAERRRTISYSASFAVALSARPIPGVGRIWADGKLLRGAAGDFKSATGFRLHLGQRGPAGRSADRRGGGRSRGARVSRHRLCGVRGSRSSPISATASRR